MYESIVGLLCANNFMISVSINLSPQVTCLLIDHFLYIIKITN